MRRTRPINKHQGFPENLIKSKTLKSKNYMTLEIKHLSAYLPYGLKGLFRVGDVLPHLGIADEYREKELKISNVEFFISHCKPILTPLSDLTKEDIKEFYQVSNVDIELIDWNEWAEELCSFIKGETPYQLRQFQYLFSRHFDLFGLIPQGLAIDINTLK